MRQLTTLLTCITISIVLLTACGGDTTNTPINDQVEAPITPVPDKPVDETILPLEVEEDVKPEPPTIVPPEEVKEPVDAVVEEKPVGNGDSVQVIAEPEAITVLVNKQFSLPEDYKPEELVYPDVKFIFSELIDKRKLRKEAAEAVENMFAGAAEDQIVLLGVSAYRSNATQKALFERYVKRDGEAKAMTYSAVPGHSEHETGLAIDVTGGDGKCAANDCFGDTKEAAWLAEHAAEYGFIVRYPEGKQDITGYKYEPWHMRYVGITIAQEIAEKQLTLEEYYNAVPVSQ